MIEQYLKNISRYDCQYHYFDDYHTLFISKYLFNTHFAESIILIKL